MVETKGKLLELLLMTCSNFEVGTILSVVGTTFPDLQCTFNTDLDQMSYLFLSSGLGTGIACILSAILMKKCNYHLLMAATMLIYSVAVMVVAVTPFIQVAIVALFFCGWSVGVIRCGYSLTRQISTSATTRQCIKLFSENAYTLHVLAAGLSAGGFLSPIIAQPFLGVSTVNKTMVVSGEFLNNTSLEHSWDHNNSSFERVSYFILTNDSNNVSTSVRSYCDTSSSTVHFLYYILGLFGLPLAAAYILNFFKKDNLPVCVTNSFDTNSQPNRNSSRSETLFIVLFILSFPIPMGLVYTYGNYLTTIGVEGNLHLGVQCMAFMTSIMWLHYFLGRLLATVLSLIVNHCLVGEILAVALLVATEDSSETFLWIGSLTLAFFVGPIYAAFLASGRQYINITSFILGMVLLVCCLGATFVPYISDQILSWYGQTILGYFWIGMSLVQLLMVCGTHGLGTVAKLQSETVQYEIMESSSITNDRVKTSYSSNDTIGQN